MTDSALTPLRPISDEGLEAANALFYQALEAGDQDLMEQVWGRGDEIICAHPGRMPIRGWEGVRASWQAILTAGGNPQVITTEAHVSRRGNLGWVTLSENLLAGEHAGVAVAVNIFEHDGDRWRLIVHQAGPVFAGG